METPCINKVILPYLILGEMALFYAKAPYRMRLIEGALSVPTDRASQIVPGFLITLSCQDKLIRLCGI